MEKSFRVGVTIHNALHVSASSEEEARQIVQDMEDSEILADCDFNITYTEEVESE